MRARAFGRLDGLVNNASFYSTPFGKISEREWQDLIGTNLRAPLFLAQAAARAARESKGARREHRRHPRRTPALANFLVCTQWRRPACGDSRALALELGPDVRVNGGARRDHVSLTRASITTRASVNGSSPPRLSKGSAARRMWPAR
jgi:pteridine reductase